MTHDLAARVTRHLLQPQLAGISKTSAQNRGKHVGGNNSTEQHDCSRLSLRLMAEYQKQRQSLCEY